VKTGRSGANAAPLAASGPPGGVPAGADRPAIPGDGSVTLGVTSDRAPRGHGLPLGRAVAGRGRHHSLAAPESFRYRLVSRGASGESPASRHAAAAHDA